MRTSNRAVERTAPPDCGRRSAFTFISESAASRRIPSRLDSIACRARASEFSSSDDRARQAIESNREGILRLAALSEMKVNAERLPQSGGAVRSTALFDVRIAYTADTVDVAAEAARLRKQIEGLEKAIATKEKQLANDVFRSRAPEHVVRELEATVAEQTTELRKLHSRLEELKAAA